MPTTSIRCTCGERITCREVVRRSSYEKVFGPSFIYLRYRCCRCRRYGERFIARSEWHEGLLAEEPEAIVAPVTPPRPEGPITDAEALEFRDALENPDALLLLKRCLDQDR